MLFLVGLLWFVHVVLLFGWCFDSAALDLGI